MTASQRKKTYAKNYNEFPHDKILINDYWSTGTCSIDFAVRV